jgi:hypothetical protein
MDRVSAGYALRGGAATRHCNLVVAACRRVATTIAG